jgi:hypothetical protein
LDFGVKEKHTCRLWLAATVQQPSCNRFAALQWFLPLLLAAYSSAEVVVEQQQGGSTRAEAATTPVNSRD